MATLTIGKSVMSLGEEDSFEEFYRNMMSDFFRIVGHGTECAYILNGKIDFIGTSDEAWRGVECLCAPDGMSLVRFESGNVGLVGYDRKHVSTLEVVTDTETIEKYRGMEEES